MKLYQIADEYRVVMAQIEAAEGEITDEQKALLDSLTEEGERKVESIAMMIRELDAEADALDRESKHLKSRRDSTVNRSEWLKNYVKDELRRLGTTAVDGKLLKVRVQNNPPSCEVLDEAMIPAQYVETVEIKKINKQAIIANYKTSGEVPAGCNITIGTSLRIR